MNMDHKDGPAPEADSGWKFVLDFYGRPGVSAACLELQDRCNVDVMVLLFSVYLQSTTSVSPSRSAIEVADAAVRPWRTALVQPLRALRRLARNWNGDAAMDRTMVVRALREAELQSEFCTWRLLSGLELPADSPQDESGQLVLRVCRHYLGRDGVGALDRKVQSAVDFLQHEVNAVGNGRHRASPDTID